MPEKEYFYKERKSMKKYNLPFLTLFFVLLLSSSCSKSKNSTSSNDTNIKKGSWKIQAASADGTDILSLIPACVLDNEITFQAGGIGVVEEKSNVCTPSNESNFLWSFKNNEAQLSMTASIIPGGTGDFTIVTLNAATLVLSQQSSLIPSPTPVTVTVTLVHP